MKRPALTISSRHAFSLAELLVVIAVIGIIAALAIPNISAITTRSHYAKDERNAQNIASMAMAAKAAGANTAGWNSVDELVQELENGITVTSVAGQPPMEFKISGLSADDRLALVDYLSVTNGGQISYIAASN